MGNQCNGRFCGDDAPANRHDRHNPHTRGQATTRAIPARGSSKSHLVDEHFRRRRLREPTPYEGVADASHFGKGGRDDGGRDWRHDAVNLKRPSPPYGFRVHTLDGRSGTPRLSNAPQCTPPAPLACCFQPTEYPALHTDILSHIKVPGYHAAGKVS